jgi:hypothetical protein
MVCTRLGRAVGGLPIVPPIPVPPSPGFTTVPGAALGAGELLPPPSARPAPLGPLPSAATAPPLPPPPAPFPLRAAAAGPELLCPCPTSSSHPRLVFGAGPPPLLPFWDWPPVAPASKGTEELGRARIHQCVRVLLSSRPRHGHRADHFGAEWTRLHREAASARVGRLGGHLRPQRSVLKIASAELPGVRTKSWSAMRSSV